MITVVVGPPCAGKSTFIRENKQPNDAVVDFDALARALGSDEHHDTPPSLRLVVRAARRAAIDQILGGSVQNAWIIDTDPGRLVLNVYRRAGAVIHVVDPGIDACLDRATSDNRPEWTASQIRRWYRVKRAS